MTRNETPNRSTHDAEKNSLSIYTYIVGTVLPRWLSVSGCVLVLVLLAALFRLAGAIDDATDEVERSRQASEEVTEELEELRMQLRASLAERDEKRRDEVRVILKALRLLDLHALDVQNVLIRARLAGLEDFTPLPDPMELGAELLEVDDAADPGG